MDVNDETENRNPAHHNTDDAVYSDAPNESTNRESEAIKQGNIVLILIKRHSQSGAWTIELPRKK